MSQVDAVRTPVSMGRVLEALSTEWRELQRSALRGDVAALLLALVDLETRTGRAVKNHNLGNIVVEQDQLDAVPWFEGVDSGNLRAFRAYGSLRIGARGLIRQLLRKSRRYWARGLLTGNPHRFVAALGGRDGGPKYFEANPKRYLKAFLGRWRRYKTGSGWGPVLLAASAAAFAGAITYAVR